MGNCLVHGGRITGVLDWELAYVGDPRFDLGYLALDYNAGKFAAPGSPLLAAVAEREWFWRRYEALAGRQVDPEVVRTFSVLGALMLIANLSSGVNVYATGRASDIRMLWSRFAIPGLRQDVVRLMDW
jgi:aminoglycoside phosphotransferase (APT) family kinase protein